MACDIPSSLNTIPTQEENLDARTTAQRIFTLKISRSRLSFHIQTRKRDGWREEIVVVTLDCVFLSGPRTRDDDDDEERSRETKKALNISRARDVRIWINKRANKCKAAKKLSFLTKSPSLVEWWVAKRNRLLKRKNSHEIFFFLKFEFNFCNFAQIFLSH